MNNVETATHTPGPWQSFGLKVRAESGSEITDVRWDDFYASDAIMAAPQRDEKQALANARLIAAAPDLYEALLRIKKVCDEEKGLSVSGAVLDQIEEYLRPALAKATGAQS